MNAWRIARKDLLQLMRDYQAFGTLLLTPVVFIAILGLSTGRMLGWRNKNEALRVAVIDQSKSDLSQNLVAGLRNRKGIVLSETNDPAAARNNMHNGEVLAVVVIQPTFTEKVDAIRVSEALDTTNGRLAGSLDQLGVEIDYVHTMSNAGSIVQMIVRGEVIRTVIPVVLRKNAILRRFVPARSGIPNPSQPEDTTGEESETTGDSSNKFDDIVYQKLVPAYTVMFTFFIVVIMSMSFVSERDQGTLRRLRTMPVHAQSLLLGKTIPYFLVSVFQGCLLFLFGRLLFGMGWGTRPWMLLPVIVTTSMAATGLGLFTATLVRSTMQVTSTTTLVIITMAGISGCFMPREWLPDLMLQLSLGTPHAWSLIAYDQLLTAETPQLEIVWRNCAVLTAFAGTFFGMGWIRFRMSEA